MKYDPDIVNTYTQKSIGLDPGFGSSPFGVVITEWVDGQIQILHAEEYERPEFNNMINTTIRLMNVWDKTTGLLFNDICGWC